MQVKQAHALQIRTILRKLTLRGVLTPESASHLSALPPSIPPMMPAMPAMSGSTALNWEGISLTAGHGPSEDNLQAQLDALEAGLAPLSDVQGNDFQVQRLRPLLP